MTPLARALLGLLALAAVPGFASEAPQTGFIAGADFSHAAFFEARGKVYRSGGQARDPFAILRTNGLTCVRLRLFTSSAQQAASNPYNYINNLDYTLPLAVRVKQAGLRLQLDFHYSDTWADPGKQTKPAAWTNLSFTQLEQRIYEYSRDTITAFKQAGALPDDVQIGNEITPGLLWPDGRVGGSYDTAAQWSNLGRLLKSAIRGVREAASPAVPRIVIHIDRGGDWAATQGFFDKLNTQQVPCDIIGLSYYPFWHGTLDQLRTCLTNAAARYGKPVLIAETAFPWVATNWDGSTAAPIVGINPSAAGQVQFAETLAGIVKAVPNGRGLGIFWWGSEYQPLSGHNLAGFEGRSFFDYQGNALPVVGALGRQARLLIPPPRRDGASLLRLSVPGPTGGVLDLERSTNLATWLTLATLTNSNGTANATVPLQETPAGFFRVRQY
jgi:arabinogalactan endo-1,4-beta-galactosidase